MSRQILIAALFAVTLAACEEIASRPNTPPDPAASGQTWLCGREYANQAWGYQRRGVVLDTAGNIWRYELRGAPQGPANPWSPPDVSVLTEADLKMRYESAVTTGAKVPAAEIARHMPLIEDAANATPPQPKSAGADMGQNLLYCYTYDTARRTYGQVMLDNKGDWESMNPSPAAKTLAAWLDGRLGEVR